VLIQELLCYLRFFDCGVGKILGKAVAGQGVAAYSRRLLVSSAQPRLETHLRRPTFNSLHAMPKHRSNRIGALARSLQLALNSSFSTKIEN